MFEHPVSRAGVTLRPGKQKYATTVYCVIQAGLYDMSAVSLVKKKTQIVCIRTRPSGSAREEAVQWVKDLLNITYQGAIPTPSL